MTTVVNIMSGMSTLENICESKRYMIRKWLEEKKITLSPWILYHINLNLHRMH